MESNTKKNIRVRDFEFGLKNCGGVCMVLLSISCISKLEKDKNSTRTSPGIVQTSHFSKLIVRIYSAAIVYPVQAG